MSKLNLKQRLKILEMASDIVAEAVHNRSIVWMVEFREEELVERLYRKMVQLAEEETEDESTSEEQ